MKKQKEEILLQSGKRLRETRLRLGKTKEEFAAALGVSENHYNKYESGAVGLSAFKLLLLNQKYSIDATWLVTGTRTVSRIDPESCFTNCSPEEKNARIDCILAAMSAKLKK